MAEKNETETTVPVDDPNASDWGKMTPDEQEATVDTLVEEAQRRSRGDPEPDEEESEESTETPAGGDETPAASDAAEKEEDQEKPKGDSKTELGEEGAETPPADWLDGETRDFASTMGLTQEDLDSLTSRDELDHVLRIINRKAFEAGKAVTGKPPGQQPAAQEPIGKKPQDGDILADLGKFKLGDDWDPEAAKPINDFVEAAAAEIRKLRQELGGLAAHSEQEGAATIRRQALESLHSLGHKELFGEPGKPPTREHAANIAKAIDAHFVHANGLFAMGREAAPTPAFLKAAVQLAFGDELLEQHQRQRAEKLKKQSAKRTGGVSSRPLAKRKPGQTKLEEVQSDPELDQLFRELVSEQSG